MLRSTRIRTYEICLRVFGLPQSVTDLPQMKPAVCRFMHMLTTPISFVSLASSIMVSAGPFREYLKEVTISAVGLSNQDKG